MHGWLWTYTSSTPGTVGHSNSTVRFGSDDVPQPDVMARLLPERGGKSTVTSQGYIGGAPDLVVEIAASSASYDTREKLQTYRRFGVAEYILWLTEENRIEWLALENDEYRPLPMDAEGIIRSRAFPGLWLNVRALLANDLAALKSTLERGMKSAEYAAFVK
jgi:Uma2 family endonuclease